MVDKFEEKEPSDKDKQPLDGSQRLLFLVFCWGTQSWGRAQNFKTSGYDQKHIDAKKSMYIGLVLYGVCITLFILLFYINSKG